MKTFSIPAVFWVTLVALPTLLSLATLVGRLWTTSLPYKLQISARFYLSPLLGLASLTVLASLMGRHLPLGNSVLVPCSVLVLVIWALLREKDKGQAIRHALVVSLFGIVCAIGILTPLLRYGAFNAHNDAFTYLSQANWLQEHAFNEIIPSDEVEPVTTQVFLYQKLGLRMGASFLLALLQAFLNLRWSYEVYPAVVSAAIASCCLSMGFPLAGTLRQRRRSTKLALLSLPALSLGGLVFGATNGFLPQTIGIAIGSGLVFMIGRVYAWMAVGTRNNLAVGKATFPVALLLVATVFAYHEFVPFVAVAVLGSAFAISLGYRKWKWTLVHGLILVVLTVPVLYPELVRMATSLKTQSGAVVGSPVVWPLIAFVFHAFGIHGGAGGRFQWAQSYSSWSFVVGSIGFGLIVGILLSKVRLIWHRTVTGALLPTVIMVAVLFCGLLYFRYLVPSPFPQGVGRSWSEFKISDWAHPFVMAIFLFSFGSFCAGRLLGRAVMVLFVMCVFGSIVMSLIAIRPLIDYYGRVDDLEAFYLKLRGTVLETCPASAPVYLALKTHQKFRQMASYYLYDRQIASDWTDDCYIDPWLPRGRFTRTRKAGDCVVEPIGMGNWSRLSEGKSFGSFRVGTSVATGMRIMSAQGGYDQEHDKDNWWYWVEREIDFKIESSFISRETNHTQLRFEYATPGRSSLVLGFSGTDGSNGSVFLPPKNDGYALFEGILNCPPVALSSISIKADGNASQIGKRDPRMARFIIRNLNLTPVDMPGGSSSIAQGFALARQ
jgi:hypothetical protein